MIYEHNEMKCYLRSPLLSYILLTLSNESKQANQTTLQAVKPVYQYSDS